MARQFEVDPPREFGSILNVRPDPIDDRDVPYLPPLIQPPVRLRPPEIVRVRKQGAEGSCTGQALAAVIEIQNQSRYRGGGDVPRIVSARMLYEMAKKFDRFSDDRLEGSSIRGAIKAFYHNGVCSNQLAPYDDGDPDWNLSVAMSKDARRVRLGEYRRLRHILNHYHVALQETGAIFCSAMIHGGWIKEEVRRRKGVIRLPSKRASKGAPLGAHAFAIVGYDTTGFLVLNSWGGSWGGFDSDAAFRRYLKKGGRADLLEEAPVSGPQRGIAHWSYDDWREHVLDAWVLRLAVPTRKPTGFAGGYSPIQSENSATDDALRTAVSVPASAIRGHYLHASGAELVGHPPYENTPETFHQTARFLVENETRRKRDRYDHLLILTPCGLQNRDELAAAITPMIPVFKQHGIYPVFLFWGSGVGRYLQSVLDRAFVESAPRSGSSRLTEQLMEDAIRPIGQPIWNDLAASARALVGNGLAADSKAWTSLHELLSAAARQRSQHPMSLHFVGHDSGALALGELVAQLNSEDPELSQRASSVSLLTPACTPSFFHAKFAGMLDTLRKFSVYNRSTPMEQASCFTEGYSPSLLTLVSRALESERETAIVGLDAHWKQLPASVRDAVDYRSVSGDGAHLKQTRRGLLRDPSVLNSILDTTLGRRRRSRVASGF